MTIEQIVAVEFFVLTISIAKGEDDPVAISILMAAILFLCVCINDLLT